MSKPSLKIGLPATLTGELGIQGLESYRGIKLWKDECIERGGLEIAGISGRTVPRLIYYDDGSDPQVTGKNTTKLINNDRVDILLGPYSSSLTLECIKTAAEYGRVVWNYGGSSDEIHRSGFSNIISTITEAGQYFRGVVDLIMNLEEHNSRIAILRKEGSGFSKHVSEGAKSCAENLGMQTRILEFSGGETDFSFHADEIRVFSADFIFCVGSAGDDINFCRFLLDSSELKYRFVATLAASINRFKSELGESAEGFVSTSQWEPSINYEADFGPDSRTFSQSFYNKFGYIPDYTAAQAYNICVVIEKLIRGIGTDEHKMREEALISGFRTFYGNFRVDPSSGKQTGHEMLVIQWQDGKRKIIYPFSISEAGYRERKV